ncbi:energy-coupling factor ABC transporter ATP-binding protein [Thorsellia anophelis]|uniref:Biotin transport system ATP-binding protein n=1 Tax=Thorsellia anophelis DSM 18579 TaxID=1123402 RepID=A0A1H9YPI2_9GAMM|nr:ATP-binding cassette domain-containing protein [Thorsellia anophelis]SES70531.1 biotin transport system ATP-binding protein [Thorsellia anophelis DSM 18579]
MIEFKEVSLSFDNNPILKEINLTLSESRIGIIGCNGGGKSSMIRLINALLLPTSGEVWVDDLLTKKNKKQVRQQVGFVFQNPDNQIVMPTVAEDFAFGLKNQGMDKSTRFATTELILKRYGLWEFRDHPAYLLSGGQKQLLAIAGVIAMQPKYIIFDEPTTLLDLRNKRLIEKTIQTLEQSAIVVSHDLQFLAHFDRIIVLDEGQVKYDGKPKEALAFYEALMT